MAGFPTMSHHPGNNVPCFARLSQVTRSAQTCTCQPQSDMSDWEQTLPLERDRLQPGLVPPDKALPWPAWLGHFSCNCDKTCVEIGLVLTDSLEVLSR